MQIISVYRNLVNPNIANFCHHKHFSCYYELVGIVHLKSESTNSKSDSEYDFRIEILMKISLANTYSIWYGSIYIYIYIVAEGYYNPRLDHRNLQSIIFVMFNLHSIDECQQKYQQNMHCQHEYIDIIINMTLWCPARQQQSHCCNNSCHWICIQMHARCHQRHCQY